MINIKFYKSEENQEDELGNKIISDVLIGSLEGSISKIVKSETVAGYDINNTIFSICVPYDKELQQQAVKANVDGVLYSIIETNTHRINQKMFFYCKKVKWWALKLLVQKN